MIYLVFASIYTPTLIFLSHCRFSFFCGKYTTFFFNCILFGRFFFRRNIEKGGKEFNLRSQLLIIYTPPLFLPHQKKPITRKRRKMLK